MSDAERDDLSSFEVRIRHPMECLPYRPDIAPVWAPRHRGRTTRPHPADRRTYTASRIVAARGLGAVRVNFRYAAFQSMFASHSLKAGRDQYFEGPHETYGFRLHEIHPTWTDVQYQPIEAHWQTRAGTPHMMTLDYGVETADGRVIFGEDKATRKFFDNDPELTERLDIVEELLAALGAGLERRVAGGLHNRMERRIVKDIFSARRTEFGEDDVRRVQKLIQENGGTAALGHVLATIGRHASLSESIVYAMMQRRHVELPIDKPPMPDTPVVIPTPARKGALRAFLAAHVPPDASKEKSR